MAVPVGESNIKVQKKLAREISGGIYNIGVLIAPQEFSTTIRINEFSIDLVDATREEILNKLVFNYMHNGLTSS